MSTTKARYGFLGPTGTFTEMALRQSSLPADAERIPFISVDAALAALRAGDLDAAMVPIENSVEGGVSATLDALASGEPLVVVAEQVVPITFVLAASAGMALADVRTISTHPHAWAQVRSWMSSNLPDAEYIPAASTASAAAGLAAPQPAYQGAVCAPVAAENHGLTVLQSDIGDTRGAVTRFVLVARPGELPAPTGADKTSVVLFQHEDHPGGLLELLEQFAARGINLTRIESRPNGGRLGDYCFSIDCEGHVNDERVGETLMGLRRVCAQVRFLGSYPRADRVETHVLPGTGEQEFVEARAWLRSLRNPSA
ncbi:MAG: prephenate dehydratase [Actinomycetota bacterium]|nr:prephenate dehydratase [Actinomycetota bacterium]